MLIISAATVIIYSGTPPLILYCHTGEFGGVGQPMSHVYLDMGMFRIVSMMRQVYCTLDLAPQNDLRWNVINMTAETVTVELPNVKLKSIRMSKPNPVRVVEGKIRIDEDQMEEGESYAFQYQDEYYLLTRTDGKLTLYGLR